MPTFFPTCHPPVSTNFSSTNRWKTSFFYGPMASLSLKLPPEHPFFRPDLSPCPENPVSSLIYSIPPFPQDISLHTKYVAFGFPLPNELPLSAGSADCGILFPEVSSPLSKSFFLLPLTYQTRGSPTFPTFITQDPLFLPFVRPFFFFQQALPFW